MVRALLAAAAASLLALGVAACGGGDGGSSTSAPPAAATSEGTSTTSTTSSKPPATSTATTTQSTTSSAPPATVSFLSPKDGTTTGTIVHAKVAVSGATGGLRWTLKGEPAKFTPVSAPQVTYTGLATGQHTLEVEVVGNGNAPTGVDASTTFIVKGGP